ncbi:MAG: hypothetical protein BWK79_12130 [Beggiatoa sp. IS2]|nr:MAG: hypothetical protein BWK79_12130 [Beggiatoa sp. IS2]
MLAENKHLSEQSFVSPEITARKERYLELEELLEFAAEQGKLQPAQITGEDGSLETISLADEVKALKAIFFYGKPLTSDELSRAEARQEKLYAAMIELVKPVAVDTLRATSSKEKNFVKRSSPLVGIFLGKWSVGHNFFRQTFWLAILLVLLLITSFVTKNLVQDTSVETWVFKILNVFDAFTLGAIGAIVFLYKNLTTFYVDRTLDPDKLATDWLRIFMGALSGGLMAMLFSEQAGISSSVDQLGLGAGAAGFLAGYSVEYFYRTLDRIIDALVPGKGADNPRRPQPSPEQLQQETLIALLNRTTDPEDKAAIRRLLASTVGGQTVPPAEERFPDKEKQREIAPDTSSAVG